MIALTQEMREELNTFLKASIEQRCTVYTLKKQRELEELRDQIALASLTATAVGSFHIYDQKVDATTDYIRNGDWPLDEGELLVYTAPPVPEIKFPEEEDCESGLEKHGLKMKAEGISQLSDGFRCGFAWHEHEIKRINGLGD